MVTVTSSVSPERYVSALAEFRPDRYVKYAELTQLVRDWEAAYPSVGSIGKTYEGCDIWVVTLTNSVNGSDYEKPAYFVDANIHAGEVEIGGWEFRYTFQNPPGPLLEEECRKNAGFTYRAMGVAPRLVILEAEAESLGEGLYKVHAVVENAGFLPTYGSEAYTATTRRKPIKVTLGLGDGMKRVMGKEIEEIGHLDGRASQYEAFSVFPSYDNDARRRVEWLVRSPNGGEITVTAGTPRAGTARQTVTLAP